MSPTKSHLVLTALLLLALAPARAGASPLFELLGGQGGLGGLQARHTGPSAASAYFNPALLVDAPAGISAGFVFVRSDYAVRLGLRSPSAAVPDDLVSATRGDGTPLDTFPIATDILRNGRPADTITPALAPRPRQGAGSGHRTNTYEMIGLTLALFRERLTLGFVGMIPNGSFTSFSTAYADEREQYFSNSLHPELYGDRLKAISLAFAAGVRLTDALALGVGATIALRALADAPVFVADAGRLQDLQINLDANAKVLVAPHLGLSWRPMRTLQLTGTLHFPQKFALETGFEFLLATGIEQGSTLEFAFDVMPWQAGLGLGWDILVRERATLTATASMLYGRWSDYVDRHAEHPSGAYAWADTMSAAAGVQLRREALGVGLDAQYKPTPVPAQTGRTSYVDNDRLGASLSARYELDWLDTRFTVGLQLQAYRLLARAQRKVAPPRSGGDVARALVADEVPDDAVIGGRPVAGRDGVQSNNPGWPGFASTGWITSGGLYLTVAL